MQQNFASDYLEGTHPQILKRLTETNSEKTAGYGQDPHCARAAERIRAACACPQAEIFFLTGGTQTNATVIDALLRSYQGVVAAQSGHINVHEVGAVEFGGHKILALPHAFGKLNAADVEDCFRAYAADENRDHTVMPGMVYLSHPTEYGTLYTKAELERLRAVCTDYGVPLYLDGARLGYGLMADGTDVTLALLAQTCDAFYIGGTKCGALFGEALVFPRPGLIPHFFSVVKQHGALLAKGWLLGLQFDTLFTDGLYFRLAQNAIDMAKLLKAGLVQSGYRLWFDSPTNQQFVILEKEQTARLAEQVGFTIWEPYDETHTVVRLATSWATKAEDIRDLLRLLLSV